MNNNWNSKFNNRGRNRGGRSRGNRGRGGFWPSRGGPRGFHGSQDTQNNYSREFKRTPKPRPNAPSKRLSENAIGVTEYVSTHEGFNGIIKSRFSDFQVAEINENGEIAELTDLSPPQPAKDTEDVDDEYLLLNKYNSEILPMETWDKINEVAMSSAPDVKKVEVDVTGMTKEQRTKIHDAVKKAFGASIVGSTVTVDDKKFVTFTKFRKGVRIDKRVKWVWPGEYVYFIVYKENCDTMGAASIIAERLRMNLKASLMGYAGTKDRRAKTSQWFCLRKFDPRKIAAACADLRDIRVGNYSFKDTILKLGMLKGNQFRICLRNVTASDECVEKACLQLKERGFINYYGLQRFGTRVDVPTHEIGRLLLQGDFGKAIDAILSPCPGAMAAALHAYHTAGAHAALRLLPRDAPPTEVRLLRALAHNANDLVGAMDQVARNARLLYVHSYQSLVWNLVASERLKKFGHQPVPGDLVPLGDVQEEEIEELVNEDEQNGETDKDGVEEDKTTDKSDTDKKEEKTTEKEIYRSRTMIPVMVLTQEDCDSGRYSIFDVVLPLPGYSVEYPPNMQEFYMELLNKDGLKLDMKHKYKHYNMSGGYRHIAVRPDAMQWRCVRYSDPYADLLLSDNDRLRGCTSTGIVDDGKYKALLLTLTLPPSSYATMALRELLKVDTSGSNQATQNDYHKKGCSEKTVKNQNDDEKSEQTNRGSEEKTEEKCDIIEKDSEEILDEGKGEKRKLESEVKEGEVKRTKQNDDEK